jgi:hypothetical protein
MRRPVYKAAGYCKKCGWNLASWTMPSLNPNMPVVVNCIDIDITTERTSGRKRGREPECPEGCYCMYAAEADKANYEWCLRNGDEIPCGDGRYCFYKPTKPKNAQIVPY